MVRFQMPEGADAAIKRIERLAREIEIIAVEFGLDPQEWLQDYASDAEGKDAK